MTKAERIGREIELLQARNAMPIRQLAQELQVSEMTIRRDISERHTDSIVVTSGVAFYRGGGSIAESYDLILEQKAQSFEKDCIGRMAASMVEPGDVFFLDIGTTAAYMAKHLKSKIDITVVCFTMNSLLELQKKEIGTLIVSGGFYHRDTQTFESDETIAMVSNIRANKAFIVPAGISMEMGLTCINQYETRVKKICLSRASRKILLADSSKFDRVSPVHFADWDEIDMVVTDRVPSDEWKMFFEGNKIQVVVAEQKPVEVFHKE